ncbi:MAG: hypothetical protein ACJ79G_03695 [Myxococcales bacterium]
MGLAVHAPALAAQGKLAGFTESGFGPVFELWRFSGDGIPQPTVDGSGNVRVTRVSQWSLPLTLSVPVGNRWTVDVTGAFASGEVKLSGVDPLIGKKGYSLSGLSDVRVRATGRVVGDNVLVTAGLNVPTGKTELDEEELSALRVLAAPALSLQVPVLGIGSSGTLGVVLARQIGPWAWALGAAYEMRNKYTPISVAAGLPVDLSPGDAVRVSLGTDRLIGQNGMTFGLSADFYTKDELESDPSGGAVPNARTQLGPIFTADWQFNATTSRFRELTFYAVERYRTEYKRDGIKVSDSDANYVDAGVRAVAGVSPSTGILVGLNARHHTGLGSDDLLTTAAIASGALTLGLVQRLASIYSLQPFVRVQGGRLKSGDASSTVSGFSGGLSLGVRF